MYQPGKLANLIQEMENINLDILGLAETRWTDSGKIIKDNHTMIYSGGEEHKMGVGIIMKNSIASIIISMVGYWAILGRILISHISDRKCGTIYHQN